MNPKICTKCKVEKPLTEFHKHKSQKDGHTSGCKPCQLKQNAKYRAENKEKRAVYDAKHYAENKEKKAQYYAENKEKKAAYDVKHNARKRAEQPNCVYQIKNLENNKVYIGETTRGELRWKEHLKHLRGNYHPNKLLKADFDEYGEEVFEWSILKEFEGEDKSNLLKEEARSIQQFIAEGIKLYNLGITIEQFKILEEDREMNKSATSHV